jgi:hypothetical protein
MSSVIIYKLGLGLATFLVLWKQCWTCNHLGESESKEQPIHSKIVIEVIVAKFPFQDPNLAGVRNTVE